MSHTEEELKSALSERAAGAPSNPHRHAQVVSRGRRMRRRARVRTALTATATATAVAATGVVFAWQEPQPDAVPVAVHLPSELPLSKTAEGLVTDHTLPLVKSVHKERMGQKVTLHFTPLSTNTTTSVRCAVPDAWIVVRWDSPARPYAVGRCRTDGYLNQYDRQSAGGSWVGSTRTLEVWVLPPQAVIPDPLLIADMPAITARAGDMDGAWAVGVYDQRP